MRSHRLPYVLSILCTAALAVMLFAMPASAAWKWVQGNLAEVEYLDSVTDPHHVHIGWGLAFTQNSGAFNYVQFPIPGGTQFQKRVRYIRLRFFTGSVDAFIPEIDVYNGGTFVQSFPDLNWSGAEQEKLLDLGSLKSFNKGLNLAIKTAAAVEPMSHDFAFYGAAANWLP